MQISISYAHIYLSFCLPILAPCLFYVFRLLQLFHYQYTNGHGTMNGRGQFPLVRYLVFVTPYFSSCFCVENASVSCVLAPSNICFAFIWKVYAIHSLWPS